jgi:ligand-binding SRPBCC domain-containing protein
LLSNPNKIQWKYIKENGTACNATVEECWKFFSSPSNLQVTPETMGFQITDFDSKPMYAGQIIQYKVTPLGYNNIVDDWNFFVKENSYFVDEQRFGPYALWHHKHFWSDWERY